MSEHSKHRFIDVFRTTWRWSAIVLAGGLGLVFFTLVVDLPLEESRVLFFLFFVFCWFLAFCCFVNLGMMAMLSILSFQGSGLSPMDLFIGWFVTIFLDIFGGFFVVMIILGIIGYGQ